MIVNRSEKLRVLRRAFGSIRPSSDGVNVACRCPACRWDGKRDKTKLAVHLNDGRYHCWVCGIKGRNIVGLIRKYSRDVFDDASAVFPMHVTRDDHVDDRPDQGVDLPEGAQLLAEHLNSRHHDVNAIISYVKSRGLDEHDMWRYRLCFSCEDKFRRRIIVPSFDAAGALNYYVSRGISDHMFPRYVNADARKEAVIFNELDIDWSRELTLVEGVFDMFKAGDNSTCMLGNMISTEHALFRRIVERGTPVVIALDAGEDEKMRRLARSLYGYDVRVRVVHMNAHKDVGEMSKDAFSALRSCATVWTPAASLADKISGLNVKDAGVMN